MSADHALASGVTFFWMLAVLDNRGEASAATFSIAVMVGAGISNAFITVIDEARVLHEKVVQHRLRRFDRTHLLFVVTSVLSGAAMSGSTGRRADAVFLVILYATSERMKWRLQVSGPIIHVAWIGLIRCFFLVTVLLAEDPLRNWGGPYWYHIYLIAVSAVSLVGVAKRSVPPGRPSDRESELEAPVPLAQWRIRALESAVTFGYIPLIFIWMNFTLGPQLTVEIRFVQSSLIALTVIGPSVQKVIFSNSEETVSPTTVLRLDPPLSILILLASAASWLTYALLSQFVGFTANWFVFVLLFVYSLASIASSWSIGDLRGGGKIKKLLGLRLRSALASTAVLVGSIAAGSERLAIVGLAMWPLVFLVLSERDRLKVRTQW